jgi:two-component sensor histidine kinase
MNKTLRLFFILIGISSYAYGLSGQARIDSLIRASGVAKEDTIKVLILNKISFAYKNIDPDKGVKYGFEALRLSEKLGWKKGLGIVYNSIQVNYSSKGDFAKALDYSKKSLKIHEELGDKKAIAVNTGNISTIYEYQGDFNTSLEYQFRSLKLREELRDTPLIATSLMNVGNVYIELGDHAKAQEYLASALRIYEARHDSANMGKCLLSTGSSYEQRKNYPQALSNYMKALAIFRSLGEKMLVQAATVNIGGLYLQMKNYPQALAYNTEALSISGEMGDSEGQSWALAEIGKTHLQIAIDSTTIPADNRIPHGKKANLAKAIDALRKAIAICNEMGGLQQLHQWEERLSLAYKLNGNYKEALETYQHSEKIKDSVFSTDNSVKIARLETQRESDLKNKQIEINRLEQTKKRNEQLLLITGIALLLIVIGAVLRANQKQKRANAEKEVLLRQKDMLMKEIHHRVKNNLQVISTLLDLQLINITDEQTKDVMTESTTRLKSISLIHQQLYQHEDVTIVEFSKFIKDLLYHVTAAFHKPGQHIVLKNEIPETILDIDTAVPLGLILNELMTNSYKYAFKNGDGFINIKFEKKNELYEMVYGDSGPGLPENLDVKKLKSLGMKVIHSLSKQLGGSFTYDSANRLFIISFKDVAGRKMTD